MLIGGIAVAAGAGYLIWQAMQAQGRTPINLQTGWNEVGIPDGWDTTAGAICLAINGSAPNPLNTVSWWDPSANAGAGGYISFDCGYSDSSQDFPVTSGMAVWFYVTEPVTLT